MPGSDPGLVLGQIPSPAQWNSYFAVKLDYAALLQNTVVTGQWEFPSIVITPGVEPGSPPDGTVWSQSDGGFYGIINSKVVSLSFPQSTVAGLPACGSGNKGQHFEVTDALDPSFLAPVVGGGGVWVMVGCNGVAWVAGG